MKSAPDGPLLEGEPGPAKEPLGVGAPEDGPLPVGPGPKRGADEGEREGTAWIVSDEAGVGTSVEPATGAACGGSVDAETGASPEFAGTTGTGSACDGSEAGAEDSPVGSAGTEELLACGAMFSRDGASLAAVPIRSGEGVSEAGACSSPPKGVSV